MLTWDRHQPLYCLFLALCYSIALEFACETAHLEHLRVSYYLTYHTTYLHVRRELLSSRLLSMSMST